MKITDFYAVGFRNLKELRFTPCGDVNIICGDNGQGKTNLLEAMWLFTGMRSFRGVGAKERDFIGFDDKAATLQLHFETAERAQVAKLMYPKENIRCKRAWLNGVELEATSKLFGALRCVIFYPEHLSLIKDGPDGRRNFLDNAVSQVRGGYMKTLWQYNKILSQRNALLKELYHKRSLLPTLEMWDLQLAKAGTYLTILRMDYAEKLAKVCAEYYAGISGGRERLSLSYFSTVFDGYPDAITYTDSIIEFYYDKLQRSVPEDIRQGFTSLGVHRDDLALLLNDRAAKSFASQGQQRSMVLSLKLSEAYLLRHAFSDYPVILFDDVLSELDASRQGFIMNHLGDMQVFITCCDASDIALLKQGRVFTMKNGALSDL